MQSRVPSSYSLPAIALQTKHNCLLEWMLKFNSEKCRSSSHQQSQGEHGSEANQCYVGKNADHTELCHADQEDKPADKYNCSHFDISP